MSEAKTPHVHVAICEIKAVLAEHGGIEKGRSAPREIGGYAFRGIDDYDNVLCGLTAKHGIALYPRVVEHSSTVQQDAKGRSQRHVEILLATDIVSKVDGSMHTIVTLGEGIDTGDKATGKAYSNARKMAFSVFQTPTTGGEDIESEAVEVAPPRTSPAPAKGTMHPIAPPTKPLTTRTADPAGPLLGRIAETNTFPLLYAIAQDADKMDGDDASRNEVFANIKLRAIVLFSTAKSLAEVKEGYPLVSALGEPAELKAAANVAYARFRQGQAST